MCSMQMEAPQCTFTAESQESWGIPIQEIFGKTRLVNEPRSTDCTTDTLTSKSLRKFLYCFQHVSQLTY